MPEGKRNHPSGGAINLSFEEELQKALQGEQLMEIPIEGSVRGDSAMSSNDFFAVLLQIFTRFFCCYNNVLRLCSHNNVHMTSNVTAGKIYVIAFLDFATFKKFSEQLAWETEVWIADMPDHMIHLNGDKFLGPRK